jgi:hypothetical protein
MVNFRVRDLDAMVVQLTAEGVAVVVTPRSTPTAALRASGTPRGIQSSCGSRRGGNRPSKALRGCTAAGPDLVVWR